MANWVSDVSMNHVVWLGDWVFISGSYGSPVLLDTGE